MSFTKKSALAILYSVLWICLSSAVIIFNKILLIQGPFPTVLAFWHLLFSTIITQILAYTTNLIDNSRSLAMSDRLFVFSILPIGLSFSLNLILNNAAYTFLSVAFIQMFKAVGPVIMLLIGGASGLYRISFPIFATICVICAGVAISSYGEMNFNTFGVLIQIAGIGCEAVRLAVSELLLSPSGRMMDPLTALYHFAPVCMAFCALAAPIVEGPNVFFDSLATWGALTLLWNCIVAFFLNLAAVVLIRHTSSLTLTVCGVPKAMLTIILSIHFWGEDIQLVQLAGFLMASAGVIHYSQLDIRKRKIVEVGTEEVGGV